MELDFVRLSQRAELLGELPSVVSSAIPTHPQSQMAGEKIILVA
jgi:hypothetical protein